MAGGNGDRPGASRISLRPRSVRYLRGRRVAPSHSNLCNSTAPRPFALTVIVPSYNEVRTVANVVKRLLELESPAPVHVLLVDDGSSDGTLDRVRHLQHPRLQVITHSTNLGKGRAVLTGLAQAQGTHVMVFDADSEYDPEDIPRAVTPLLTGRAEVVYGSRMSGFGTVHPTFTHLVGNRLMTLAANILFGAAISDLHTCIKILPVPLVRELRLTESGFALDTEISAELLRLGFRPFEIPISYVGRSKEDGKKIRFWDSLRCLYVLVKVRMRPRTKFGMRDRHLAPATFLPGFDATHITSLESQGRTDLRPLT